MGIIFNLEISNKEIENNYDVSLFIRKRNNHILWRQEVMPGEVQVSYLESTPISSGEAIKISDHLAVLRISDVNFLSSTKESYLVSTKDNLIFTSVTRNSNYGNVPMFYCHRIPSTATSVSFLPWNKSADSDIALYNDTYKAIFSDLNNELEVEEEKYNASYVKYLIPNGDGYITKTEIYKGEPFFREINNFDIEYNSSLGEFIVSNTLGVYKKTSLPDGKWLYEFYKDSETTIYYKEDENSKLKCQVSGSIIDKYSWPLELTGKEISLTDSNDITFSYVWVDPQQEYFPYYPYLSMKKEGSYINPKTLLVPNSGIVVNPNSNLHISLRVIRNGTLLFAQTTRPALIGKKISGSLKNENVLRYEEFTGDVDYQTGAIALKDALPIKYDDQITVEYVIDGRSYERVIGNLNPRHNKEILKSTILYYATPKNGTEISEISWISYKEVYTNASGQKGYVLTNCKNENLKEYLGIPLDTFLSDFFIVNPYTQEKYANAYNYLPIATVLFDKEKYIKQTMHKDIRVLSGLKEDLSIEQKGKDYTFSNILNPAGTYTLSHGANVVTLVDRQEIKENSEEDIPRLCSNYLGINFNNRIIYSNTPVVESIKIQQGEGEYLVSIKVKKYNGMERLSLFESLNKSTVLPGDSLLGNLILEDNLEIDGDDFYLLEKTINEENFSSNAKAIKKIYVYCKWSNGDGYESDYSPIACIHIKE